MDGDYPPVLCHPLHGGARTEHSLCTGLCWLECAHRGRTLAAGVPGFKCWSTVGMVMFFLLSSLFEPCLHTQTPESLMGTGGSFIRVLVTWQMMFRQHLDRAGGQTGGTDPKGYIMLRCGMLVKGKNGFLGVKRGLAIQCSVHNKLQGSRWDAFFNIIFCFAWRGTMNGKNWVH